MDGPYTGCPGKVLLSCELLEIQLLLLVYVVCYQTIVIT
jgi:hypothetical protein